jgi:hypothetical protein
MPIEITRPVMASRPLFDPEPENFVANETIKDAMLKICRLSDFVVVAFAVLVKETYLLPEDVKGFTTVFQDSHDYLDGIQAQI